MLQDLTHASLQCVWSFIDRCYYMKMEAMKPGESVGELFARAVSLAYGIARPEIVHGLSANIRQNTKRT